MKPDETEHKFRRIGVRLFNEPHRQVMFGYDAEVYDVETGEFLAVTKADLHIAADSLVMATITVEVAEVDIRERPRSEA